MIIVSKSTNVLLFDLYDIQRDGVMVDTSLILDDGELPIHCSVEKQRLLVDLSSGCTENSRHSLIFSGKFPAI